MKNEIDPDNFEAHWDLLSETEKVNLIKTSPGQGLDTAVAPALKGLDSFHFPVRTQARKTLESVRAGVNTLLYDPSNTSGYISGQKTSARICAQIFSKIIPGIPVKDRQYLFKMLLGFEGSGTHFAFKALYLKRIEARIAESICLTVSDTDRLKFLGEYLKADPVLRLTYASLFRRLTRSVKNDDAIVDFYARLFDAQQDADPFLYNLPAGARNPDRIITALIRSESPDTRQTGLKALSMVLPKIPPDLLLDILENEPDFSVRKTLYRIIENSSLGTYPEIFDPLLALLGKKADKRESFHAFKALIVAGKQPLHTVLDIARKNHPALLGFIYQEISELSKISFFFIQDIALNREIYAEKHFEINLAVIFGMIKKRPERVVRLLKSHISKTDSTSRRDIARFIKKTDQLLAKEKKSIVVKFAALARQLKTGSHASEKGRLKTFFSSVSQSRKIENLKKSHPDAPINFEGDTVIDTDLSGVNCTLSAATFIRSVFINCDIGNAGFVNTCFKKSVLIDVDLENTTFETVCFHDAVFINVNARNTVFKNCSFQNASFCNCNFNRAQIKGGLFVTSTLSNCRFQETDLSGASFAYSHISAISFEASNLDQADFSGIRARFCRFPTHARASVTADAVDLNARKYQLELTDIPRLEDPLVSEINMLIFSEFIHYGEMKFHRQNKYSLLTAFDIFKPRQADLFIMIPFLLHKNIHLPAFKQRIHPQTPRGIHDYRPSPDTLAVIARYGKGRYQAAGEGEPAIEGLFTIGSIGSIAQTDNSDIDYWVCIREDRIPRSGIELLKQKLQIIELFAQAQFHIQITFFLVDIRKSQQNDFGDSTTESSGSAQAMLLKEEFYRTMIQVAGKLPLWAVLPTAISKNCYHRILEVISSFPDLTRYIDLGDIHTISPGEFFGATIWQLFKSLKSPFKSVIKMALLEKYIREAGKKPLLCNSVKDEWMNSGVNLKLARNDAYYILLKNLLSFFEKSDDAESASMLVTCFFLKLGIAGKDGLDQSVFGLRKILLSNCMEKWNWSQKQMLQAGSYASWPCEKIAALSASLESYMIKKYKRINSTFDTSGRDTIRISPEDRTVLGRKVYSELSRRPGKISKVLLISNAVTPFRALQLKYNPPVQKTGPGSWELINKQTKIPGRAGIDTVTKAATIEEIGAWLILNKLYKVSGNINLVPNATGVTADDIIRLFKALNTHFDPILKTPTGFDQLLEKETITSLFICVNFYAPQHQTEITDYCAVYLNSWGEMYTNSRFTETAFSGMDKMMAHLKSRLNIATVPALTTYYTKGKPHQFSLYKKNLV